MADAPTGTVTLLFTDIEGSTKLLQRAGDAYADLLDQHRRLLRTAFTANGGYEVDTEGDAFFVAFPSANDAVVAAAEAQQALVGHKWPKDREIRVRMGLHTGEPRLIEGKYTGIDVHRAARVMAAGHGGQVLLSQATRELLDDRFQFHDLGEHRLKDLSQPQRLFQLLMQDLRGEFPPLKTLENRPTNLPVQQTALVGREYQLQELGALLGRADVRLVTLTGPGGTGKTRLALQLAAELIDEFPNGVFFVSLAPLVDPDLVVPTIAQTLGLRESGGQTIEETLGEYTRDKSMLLLLDNFEQIIEAAPQIAVLLTTSRALKLLVTSRMPLHLSGEQEYAVPPLLLPDLEHLPDLASLSQYEAVALFIERARSIKTGFAVTNENAPAVAEICVRLDGLPLALELAAARIRSLPPRTLLARLDERLKLLTGGARDLEDRQRTLRATIEWSFDLLSEEEQALFARLGVFVGGCRIGAAEAVCDPEGALGLDVFDGLTALVEKSLVRQKEDSDGEPRFWMLETIREYALNSLEMKGEVQELHHHYALHFLGLAEEAEPHLLGPAARDWTKRLAEEHDNLRASLTHLNQVDPGLAVRLCGALWHYWSSQGFWTEGRESLEQALRAPDARPSERAQALTALGDLAASQGDYAVAKEALDRAISLWKEVGSARGEALATGLLGWTAERHDDYARAQELAVAALALLDGVGERDALTRGNALALLGAVAGAQGRYDESASLARRGLDAAQEAGLHSVVAARLGDLGTLERLRGNSEAAERFLLQALQLSVELNESEPRAHALMNLSHVARARDDLPTARTYAEEAVTATRKLASKSLLAMSLMALLRVLVAEGDLDSAAPLAVDLVARCQELGDRQGLTVSLEWLGRVTIDQGDAERGVRLLRAAASIRHRIGFARSPSDRVEHERFLQRAEENLGRANYERAWNEGEALELEKIVDYALKEQTIPASSHTAYGTD